LGRKRMIFFWRQGRSCPVCIPTSNESLLTSVAPWHHHARAMAAVGARSPAQENGWLLEGCTSQMVGHINAARRGEASPQSSSSSLISSQWQRHPHPSHPEQQ
jgi:hypothetical protein